MSRKRWIAIGVGLVLALLILILIAGAVLVRYIPRVAWLVHGGPASATPLATFRTAFTPRVPIATTTLKPVPTQVVANPTSLPSPIALPTVAASHVPLTSLPASPSPASSSEPPTPSPTSSPEPPTSTPLPPTPVPQLQWIAFETERGEFGDYEIFAVATDGSGLTNLTNSWADDVAPVWSPDGRHVAFVSYRHTLSGKWSLGKGSIYILDFDPRSGIGGGDVRRLTSGASDDWPTWSPDGQRIAFQSDRSGNWDLWSINVDGSGLTRLTDDPAADRYPDWSPDGQKIAFTSKRSGNEDVWVLDVAEILQGAEGLPPVNLTRTDGRDRYPMWSPDGERLTFSTERDGDLEIYMMNADGSNPQNVSRAPESTEGLADWSPDGKSLVLYSNRTGNKEVFIVNLLTGKWINLTNHPASDEFATWSP